MSSSITKSSRDLLARLFGRGRKFVSVGIAAKELGIGPNETAKQMSRWAAAGWLRRIRRGTYMLVPVEVELRKSWTEDPLLLAAEVWSPCFFTGWTSASHWHLTDQIFRTTIVRTSKRVRARKARIHDHDYMLGHVGVGDFWGLEKVWSGDRRINFADPARTVVDILDETRIGGGIRHAAEIVEAYLDGGDVPKLLEYAERLGNRTVFKRLGYIVESLALTAPGLVARCRSRLSTGFPALDPLGPPGGRISTAWRLRINVPLAKENKVKLPWHASSQGGRRMNLGRLEVPAEPVHAFCRKWKVKELSVFGSALGDDFHPDSDVDLLVSFESGAEWSLFDHGEMQIELSEMLGRRVDLVTRGAVEMSRNPYRRREILDSARLVFAA